MNIEINRQQDLYNFYYYFLCRRFMSIVPNQSRDLIFYFIADLYEFLYVQ